MARNAIWIASLFVLGLAIVASGCSGNEKPLTGKTDLVQQTTTVTTGTTVVCPPDTITITKGGAKGTYNSSSACGTGTVLYAAIGDTPKGYSSALMKMVDKYGSMRFVKVGMDTAAH